MWGITNADMLQRVTFPPVVQQQLIQTVRTTVVLVTMIVVHAVMLFVKLRAVMIQQVGQHVQTAQRPKLMQPPFVSIIPKIVTMIQQMLTMLLHHVLIVLGTADAGIKPMTFVKLPVVSMVLT